MFQTQKDKKSRPNFIKSNILIFVAGIILISATSTVIGNLGKEDRIQKAQDALEELKKEQAELLVIKERVETDEFIETEARAKLGVAKPGEVVVILPEDDVLRRLAPLPEEEESYLSNIPIWRRWTKLFFEF